MTDDQELLAFPKAHPVDGVPADDRFRREHCDLCIVGAGVAGLNALFAASTYLTKEHRVILIDKNPSIGGMWTETYDYVRLHQPHPMFTAGNIPWTLDREPSHLATKDEVLAHFKHCLEVLRARVDLVDLYGYAYVEHREVPTDGGYQAHVVCEGPESGQKRLLIRATRLIKAFGYRIPQNEPLSLSSHRVRSVSPHSEAFRGGEMAASDKPVYVVGGGKTGMDTAYELIQRRPNKQIHLVAGSGTVFFNRNRGFPKGTKRWWGGHTSFKVFRDLALKYDGDNEDEAIAFFKRRYAIGLRDDCKQYMFGVLSEEENAIVSGGLQELIMDYVSDVIDDGDDVVMVFRSGERRAIEPGSWIVNCTGHLMRMAQPYEPYLSEHGAVLSIQPTSAIHFLTSVSAYFLVHLFYLGKLESLPLYEMNQQELMAKNKAAWSSACAAHALHNVTLIVGAVPSRVMQQFGLNFDLWYPPHRRLLDFIQLKRNGPRYAEHCRQTLDRVREKYGIRCGVLVRDAARREGGRVAAAAALR